MGSSILVLNQPGVFLVDEDGNTCTRADAAAIGSAEGVLVAGKNGTDAYFFRVETDGTLRVDPTGTTVQPVSATTLPLPTGAATEATLLTLATETKLEAVRALVALLEAKDFATETKLEAVRVLLASLEGKDFATETTLAALKAAFDARDLATETTLAALNNKLNSDIHSALVTIDLEHHEVHEGQHFVVVDWLEISGYGTTYELLLKVPATGYHHLLWSFAAGGAFTYQIFEEPTVTADGTSVATKNSMRDSATTSTLEVYTQPTTTADGTEILHGQISEGGKSGTSKSRQTEVILGLSKNYLIRFTKTEAGTEFLEYELRWYE